MYVFFMFNGNRQFTEKYWLKITVLNNRRTSISGIIFNNKMYTGKSAFINQSIKRQENLAEI